MALSPGDAGTDQRAREARLCSRDDHRHRSGACRGRRVLALLCAGGVQTLLQTARGGDDGCLTPLFTFPAGGAPPHPVRLEQ